MIKGLTRRRIEAKQMLDVEERESQNDNWLYLEGKNGADTVSPYADLQWFSHP